MHLFAELNLSCPSDLEVECHCFLSQLEGNLSPISGLCCSFYKTPHDQCVNHFGHRRLTHTLTFGDFADKDASPKNMAQDPKLRKSKLGWTGSTHFHSNPPHRW